MTSLRLRTFSAAALLAVAAAVPLAGTALAQDRNCDDFATQQEAQAALLPGDPDGLDRNGDGVACESLPSGAGTSTGSSATDTATGTTDAAAQVAATPVGGVEAGGGPVDGVPIALGALLAGGVGAVAVRRVAARRG